MFVEVAGWKVLDSEFFSMLHSFCKQLLEHIWVPKGFDAVIRVKLKNLVLSLKDKTVFAFHDVSTIMFLINFCIYPSD